MPSKKASPTRKPRHRENESFHAAMSAYAEAMTLFTQRNWRGARDAFTSLLKQHGDSGEFADIADRARTHIRACDRRLAPAAPSPTTAEEWLLSGVVLANQGATDDALAALEHARAAGAPPARVHYARAAALAAADRNEEALADLARAIEADPTVRFQSLLDPDFERLRETAGYVALVEPPRLPGGEIFEDEFEEEKGEEEDLGDVEGVEDLSDIESIEDIDDEEAENDFGDAGETDGGGEETPQH